MSFQSEFPELDVKLPDLLVRSKKKYDNLSRQMLMAALDGLSHEVSQNTVYSNEWSFYRQIIENICNHLEEK